MVKGVFFDMGGVLTSNTHGDALNWMASMLNMNEQTKSRMFEEFKVKFKTAKTGEYKTVSQVMQNTLDNYRKGFNALELYKQHIMEDAVITSGVAETIEKLKGMGLKVGVISNTDNALANVTIEKFGLEKMLDVVLTAETAGMYKTNKLIFDMACKQMGFAPEETMWVGNSIEDNASAKAIGMKTVLIGVEGDSDYKISKIEELIGIL
jgi:HAD superfamily hydrolase (TIGR01509 family)